MRVKTRALRAELSALLGLVHESPVEVTKHGEVVAVIISPKSFHEFQRLLSAYTSVATEQRRRLAFHQ
jgi:prevent-host-death family protein